MKCSFWLRFLSLCLLFLLVFTACAPDDGIESGSEDKASEEEAEDELLAKGQYVTEVNGMRIKVDASFFPGFTRKAIAFSYDDGNATYDPIVAELLLRYGYVGSFMVNTVTESCTYYAGHAVENHLKSALHNANIKYDPTRPNAEQTYSLAEILGGIRETKASLEASLPAGTVNPGGEVRAFAIPMSSGFRFDAETGSVDNDYRGEALDGAIAAEYNEAAYALGKPAGYVGSDFSAMTDREIYFDYLAYIGVTVNRVISGGYSLRAGDLFALPEDFLYWEPSMHQTKLRSSSASEYKNEYADAFLALPDNGEMQCLLVWGHPTEIDSSTVDGGKAPPSGVGNNVTYAELQGFLETFASPDYYKGSMAEIAAYATAARSLRVGDDGSIENPSSVPVYMWVEAGGERFAVTLPPHGVFRVSGGDAPDGTAVEASIADYYGDKTAAVSLTFDDGQYESVAYASEVFARYGIRGTAFLIPAYHNKTRVPPEGTDEYEDFIAMWQELVAEGNIDIGNHSYHHYGNLLYVKGTPSREDESFESEILRSHELLREYFPENRLVSFAVPGAAIGDACADALAAYGYYCNRMGGALSINYPYSEDFDPYRIGSQAIIKATNVALMNGNVDRAIKTGGWYVEMWHYVEDEWGEPYWKDTDPDYSAPRKTLDAHAAYLYEKRDDVWCGSFNDVAAYVLEKRHASFQVSEVASDRFACRLSTDLVGDGFDHPLTLHITLPDGWTGATVTQNGTVIPCRAVVENGCAYIILDLVPNGDTVTVTKG